MKLAEIKINDFGGAPCAEHNMPCPVCREKPAVLNLNEGVFHPCWYCQNTGWVTLQARGWRRWLAKKLFGEMSVR